MPKPDATIDPETLARAARLLGMIHSSWISQALYVAAELKLADLLLQGPKSAQVLAGEAGTPPDTLERLLRALVTLEICNELDDGRFEITPLGALLGTETNGSMRAPALYTGSHIWPIWGNLLYSVKTGESARTLLSGTEGFGHLEQDPELAKLFYQVMIAQTRLVSHGVVQSYDFSEFARVVDVGGGYGELLAAILRVNPRAQGVLCDLPQAMEQARRYMEQAQAADRCEFVGGSFFESVPEGGDAYILKSVIHDWNDERARAILANCRRAIRPGAKLLLVERIVPTLLEPSAAHQAVARSDLHMLVVLGAKERTQAEFQALLGNAGFTLNRTVPINLGFCLIEAV